MKTNNGDDRMKAHDVFPGVCYPDLFCASRDSIDSLWHLICRMKHREGVGPGRFLGRGMGKTLL